MSIFDKNLTTEIPIQETISFYLDKIMKDGISEIRNTILSTTHGCTTVVEGVNGYIVNSWKVCSKTIKSYFYQKRPELGKYIKNIFEARISEPDFDPLNNEVYVFITIDIKTDNLVNVGSKHDPFYIHEIVTYNHMCELPMKELGL